MARGDRLIDSPGEMDRLARRSLSGLNKSNERNRGEHGWFLAFGRRPVSGRQALNAGRDEKGRKKGTYKGRKSSGVDVGDDERR